MNCPSCKESMIALEIDQIEIDYSDTCGGIWLDAGELEMMLEDSTEKDELLESFRTAVSAKEKPRKCPICGRKMRFLAVSAAGGVLIDQCPRGHGYWFDKGELQAIIEVCGKERNSRVLNLLKSMFANTFKTEG